MGKQKTVAEALAEEEAEAEKARASFEDWKYQALDAAGWPDVSEPELEWLEKREPDAQRAALVLLSLQMMREFPQ